MRYKNGLTAKGIVDDKATQWLICAPGKASQSAGLKRPSGTKTWWQSRGRAIPLIGHYKPVEVPLSMPDTKPGQSETLTALILRLQTDRRVVSGK